MGANEPEFCERCRRVAPGWDDPSYSEWEAIERSDGRIGVICPGCITASEQAEMDADDLDTIRRARDEGA
jgi:hypothetical protein